MAELHNEVSREEVARLFVKLFELAGDQWLTPEEAARDADVEPQTIYNWLTRREPPLPAQKQGRLWRIRRRELLKYMRGNPELPPADVLDRLAGLPGYEELLLTALRVLWFGLELNIAETYERGLLKSDSPGEEAQLAARYAVWDAKTRLDKALGEIKSDSLVRLLRTCFLTPAKMPHSLATALLNSPQLSSETPLNLGQSEGG